MTDRLTKAIAEFQRIAASKTEHILGPHDARLATILQAVASGELVPASDVRLAVTEALRMAARVAGEAPYTRDRMVCGCAECQGEWAEAAILALSPDALAEVQKLKRLAIAGEITANLHKITEARAEAAWAKVARLMEALEWYADDTSSQGDIARAAVKGSKP